MYGPRTPLYTQVTIAQFVVPINIRRFIDESSVLRILVVLYLLRYISCFLRCIGL